MGSRQLHGAFWLLYAANRILQENRDIEDAVSARFRQNEGKLLQEIAKTDTASSLQMALIHVLAYDHAGTLAEEIIRALDAELFARGTNTVVLLYDSCSAIIGIVAWFVVKPDVLLVQKGAGIDNNRLRISTKRWLV